MANSNPSFKFKSGNEYGVGPRKRLSEKLLRDALHQYGWKALQALAQELEADKSADRTKAAKYLLDLCVVVPKVTEGADEASVNLRMMDIVGRLTDRMSSDEIGMIIKAATEAAEEAKEDDSTMMDEQEGAA